MAENWKGVRESSTDPRYPWLHECAAELCYRRLTFASREEAERDQRDHACPQVGAKWIGEQPTMSILSEAWGALDLKYAEYKSQVKSLPESEKARLQGEMRGMAEVIAMFMSPFFSTADAVGLEVVRRWKAKASGEQYETPGLGSLKYAFPGVVRGAAQKGVAAMPDVARDVRRPGPGGQSRGAVSRTGASGAANLTEKQLQQIKFGVANGLPVATIAKTYGISEAAVTQICGA